MNRIPLPIALGLLAFVALITTPGCSGPEKVPTAGPSTAPEVVKASATPEAPFTVTQEIVRHYTPGAPVTVKATMNYTGTEPVTALALQTELPPAWVYGGIQGDLKPAIDPPAGTTGTLTLIWIQIPAFPATVEYTLNVPDWAEGTYTLSAHALYRTLGGELHSPVDEVPTSGPSAK